jgi:tRNA A64-2'-O-ribosylphosphate transferase
MDLIKWDEGNDVKYDEDGWCIAEKENEKEGYEEWKEEGNFFQMKRKLRREENNIYYRLTSIVSDAENVKHLHTTLAPTFPLIANLRCGLWYSSHFADHCYFKSTDGHVGHWTFSLNRLNLNVIE